MFFIVCFFYSSGTSSWCQSFSRLRIGRVRVLAPATEAQRNHPEVYRLLLEPVPHGKPMRRDVLISTDT